MQASIHTPADFMITSPLMDPPYERCLQPFATEAAERPSAPA